MTGTRNPSRKYFKRNQPYFYKSADNWEEWDTDESYDRTFFIGIDDTNPADIDVALYMIWGGKPVAAVGSKVLDTVSGVVDTARQLETEIQSILKEVQGLAAAVAQSQVDIEEAVTKMNALVDRCEGILEGAEAARDLAKDWANKMNGTVDGTEYSAKYYANEAKNSETAAAGSASNASASATTATEQAAAAATSAEQAATSASTAASYASSAHTDASGAANSAQAAQDSATSAANSATSAANSATDSANSATDSATSAQAAQEALDNVHGLIATPIGTIFQSIYVDESLDIARQLNGQLISSTKFTGFRSWLNTVQTATPNLFTTETNWQAEKTNSKLGQCGKFVIDDTAGTIRLPCVVNAQGLVDLQYLGTIKSESLPNITGSARFDNGTIGIFVASDATGAFKQGNAWANSAQRGAAGNSGPLYYTEFNASRSSSTYQDNAPVQQEAVQYPYYIQVATGIEETLPAIREYKTNVPYVLGDSKYSETNPYNASWLVSNGQYNAKTIYPDMWTQLQVELNSSLNKGDTVVIDGKTYVKQGLPVKLSTSTYTDYDFVVNQNDQTFRLPLLDGSEDLPSDVFETWTLGNSGQIYPITKNGFICLRGVAAATSDYMYLSQCQEAGTIDVKRGISAGIIGVGRGGNVQLYLSKGSYVYVDYSGWTDKVFTFNVAKGNGSLYYYVGDTVQDASLINAGAVLGQLSNKADIDASNFNADGKSLLSGLGMPSNRYIDLTVGASGATYTAPANGYFFCARTATAAGQHLQVEGGNSGFEIWSQGANRYSLTVPVRKGMTVYLYYTMPKANIFRFVYAEGEN